MQLGRARITPTEREHRRRQGLCMYCASPAHTIASCPAASSGAYYPGTPPSSRHTRTGIPGESTN